MRDKETKAVVSQPPLIMKVHLQIQHHDKVCSHYLNIILRMRIHIIKKQLVILELMIPFGAFSVAEVISQRGQDNCGTEKLRLLSILVQKHLGPATGKGVLLTAAGPLITKCAVSHTLPVPSLADLRGRFFFNYYTHFYYHFKISINSLQREKPHSFSMEYP